MEYMVTNGHFYFIFSHMYSDGNFVFCFCFRRGLTFGEYFQLQLRDRNEIFGSTEGNYLPQHTQTHKMCLSLLPETRVFRQKDPYH